MSESGITGGAVHLGMDTSKNTIVVATLTPRTGSAKRQDHGTSQAQPAAELDRPLHMSAMDLVAHRGC